MFEYFEYNSLGCTLNYCQESKNYSSINTISYMMRINYNELEDIIKNYNGREIWSHIIDGEFIQFKNREDCRSCVEYLNSMLVLNKLVGD